MTTTEILALPMTGSERDVLGCLQHLHDSTEERNLKYYYLERLSDFKARLISKYTLIGPKSFNHFLERL